MWSPWAKAAPTADPSLEVAVILDSSLSQPFKGIGLRVIYLVERVCCQLAGEDALQVPMDPLVFMLAPHSMTNAEYNLWRPGIPFTNRVTDELDYDEFSGTLLMPSFIVPVCVLSLLFPLISQHLHYCTLVTLK